jgi:steroid 5-alpha reductase family enzyme
MEDFDPSYGPVMVVHLDEHCIGNTARKALINLLVRVRRDTTRTIISQLSHQIHNITATFLAVPLHHATTHRLLMTMLRGDWAIRLAALLIDIKSNLHGWELIYLQTNIKKIYN